MNDQTMCKQITFLSFDNSLVQEIVKFGQMFLVPPCLFLKKIK